jgi:hypothetical protein
MSATVAFDAVEQLRPFVKPDHHLLKDVLAMWNYRGDGTETGARRMRAIIGEQAFESLYWDTVACSGRVLVVVPRCKAPGTVEAPRGMGLLSAPHWWALTQVEEKHPDVTHARPETIQRVPVEIAQQLHALPDLEFVDVKDVHFWESGRGPSKKRKKAAPQDVVYFRFAFGYGCVAAAGGAA